jgi:hypothetical protein
VAGFQVSISGRFWVSTEEQLFRESPGEAFDQLVLAACHRIHEWTESYSVVSLALDADPKCLRRLLPIIVASVRSADDIKHVGVYSPDRRDNAQEVRARLISRLGSLPGPDAIAAMRELAEDPRVAEYRDWLLMSADARSARIEPCGPLSLAAAIAWSAGRPGAIETDSDLFQASLDRLNDVRMFVEQHDHSYRSAFTALVQEAQEDKAQLFLTSELGRRSLAQYTVAREEEADRRKKPDIRVSSPRCGGPVSIEVKIAEHWSYNDLEVALNDQLVGKYLRAVYSRRGILVLCAMGQPKRWRDPQLKKLLDFSALVQRLNEKALLICATNPDVDSLRVVGIDFH